MKINRRRGLIFSYQERKILTFFFLAFWVMLGLSFLPVWQVKQFIPAGCQNLSSAAIEKSLNEFLDSSLWHLKTGEIQKKLSQFPAIQKAVLKRKFFSRLVVEIRERTAYAFAAVEKTTLVIDQKGQVIADSDNFEEWRVNPFTFQNLPLVVGLVPSDFENNRLAFRVLAASQKILAGFKKFAPSGQIKIDFKNKRKIQVLLSDALPIILGDDSVIDKKIEVLKILLPVVWKDAAAIEYIDIAVPSCPVVKYRKA